jgi:hypothetical protein
MRQLVVSLFLFLSPFLIPTAFAEETKNGVVIEPAIQKIFWGETGLREPVQNIALTNTTGIKQAFTVEAIEFTNIDKYGGNIFLGQSIAEGDFKEAPWVALDRESIMLAPGEKGEIQISLQNEDSLAPGAHYGAVLLRAIKPDGDTGEDPSRVYLRQVAASLLYVSKEAGGEKKLTAEKVRYFRSSFFLPDTATVTLVNQGSNFVEPRGFAVVEDFRGKEIKRGILNETSKTLFPGQERELEARFEKINYFLPGKYMVTVYYRFDDGEYQKISTTLWYWEPLALLAVIIFAGFALWRGSRTFLWLKKEKSLR